MNRADSWQFDRWVFVSDKLADFRSTPFRFFFFKTNNQLLDLIRNLIGVFVWCSTTIIKPARTVLLIAIPDLVSGHT